MINFTTTLSYGLRLLANIALAGDKPKQLRKIAKEEDISLLYLRKLIPSLEKAGFIKSVRGPGGGFILRRRPYEINLLEIINILSRNKILSCIEQPAGCERIEDCLIKDTLKDAYRKMQDIFKHQTLQTIIKKQKVKEGG